MPLLTSLLVPVLVAMSTGLIEWHRFLRRRRLEQVGLYVNPFLLAAEALQSRIYNLAERSGAQPLLAKLPDGQAAFETLYLASVYFGWERVMYRHGPYVQDGEFVKHTQEIRKAFATSDHPLGAFCFFRTEQEELGLLAVRRTAKVFETVSMTEFRESLESTGLAGSGSMTETLKAFEKGDLAEPVCARLIQVQRNLVPLLAHIEQREGVQLFVPGPRKLASRRSVTSTSLRRAG